MNSSVFVVFTRPLNLPLIGRDPFGFQAAMLTLDQSPDSAHWSRGFGTHQSLGGDCRPVSEHHRLEEALPPTGPLSNVGQRQSLSYDLLLQPSESDPLAGHGDGLMPQASSQGH